MATFHLRQTDSFTAIGAFAYLRATMMVSKDKSKFELLDTPNLDLISSSDKEMDLLTARPRIGGGTPNWGHATQRVVESGATTNTHTDLLPEPSLGSVENIKPGVHSCVAVLIYHFVVMRRSALLRNLFCSCWKALYSVYPKGLVALSTYASLSHGTTRNGSLA